MITCPIPEDTLLAFLVDTLDAKKRAEVVAHLDTCETCRATRVHLEAQLAACGTLPLPVPPRDLAVETLQRIDLHRAPRRSRWLELGVISVCVVLVPAFLLPSLGRSREAARRASSQNNLKEMGLVFEMYCSESPKAMFPPLTPVEQLPMFDLNSVYPEYFSDPNVLQVPGYAVEPSILQRAFADVRVHPEGATGIAVNNYIYLGYVVRNTEELTALLSYQERARAAWPKPFDWSGATPLPALQHGVEHMLSGATTVSEVEQAASEIVVMFENPNTIQRVPPGVNVLFLDGHVEFVKLSNFFPGADWKKLLPPAP